MTPQFLAIASRRAQLFGIRVGGFYVSLAGPRSRPLFSERNRRGVSVMPLLMGWRIRLRRNEA